MDGSLVHDTAAQAAKKVVAGYVRIHSASVCRVQGCTEQSVRVPTDLSAPPKQSKKASAMSLRCGSVANSTESPWLDATGGC